MTSATFSEAQMETITRVLLTVEHLGGRDRPVSVKALRRYLGGRSLTAAKLRMVAQIGGLTATGDRWRLTPVAIERLDAFHALADSLDPDLSTSTEEVNQMTPRPVQAVTYNGGDGKENEFALIVKEHEGGATADLLVFDENGAGTHREAVPRRDPSDYGAEGGGHTWH